MKTLMNFIRLAAFIAAVLVTSPTFSQWSEMTLPSRSPENKFVISGGLYFTYQSMGGIYKSTDEGHSWTRSMSGFPSTHELRGLYSFHNMLFAPTFNEGIYVSKDFGDNWEAAGDLPKDAYEDLTLHNNRLYTINRNGFIFVSEDLGAHWARISEPEAWNNTGEYRRIFSNGQDLLFAIGEGYLYKSDDNGVSWRKVDFGTAFHPPGLVYDIAIHHNAIWITAVDHEYSSILLHSLDYGQHWNVLYKRGGFHMESVAASDQFVAYMQGGSIYYSADNGKSWSTRYISGGGKIVHHTADAFLVSSPGGVKMFHASNGTSSDFGSAGIKGYDISNVEIMENELVVFSNNLLLTPSSDLFTLHQGSEALTVIPKSTSQLNNLQDIAVLQGNLFGLFNNKLFRFNSENRSWVPAFVGVENILNIAAGQKRLFVRTFDDFFYAESSAEVLTRLNVRSGGLLQSVFENDSLTIVNSSNEILISRDGASTWESRDPDGYAASYTSTAATKSRIFTCTINGLFVSDDKGSTWKKVNHELIYRPEALLYHHGRLYVGTRDGILVSPDEGTHWFIKTWSGIPAFPTKSLVANETYLFANTHGGGIRRIGSGNLNDVPVIVGVVGDTLRYELGQDIVLKTENLNVRDEDNTFPKDFQLVILEGEHYRAHGAGQVSLTDTDVRELKVNVQVTDGIAYSNTFEVPVLLSKPLGVAKHRKDDRNRLYPNPTSSFLHFNVKRNEACTVYVSDLAGRIVMQATLEAINSVITLNVTKLVAGVYAVSIHQGDFVVKQRIIKN